MSKQRFYLNPLIGLKFHYWRNGEKRYCEINGQHCRQVIINQLWDDFGNGAAEFKFYGKPLQISLTLPAAFEPVSEFTIQHDPEYLAPDTPGLKRLADFATDKLQQQQLLELASLAMLVPALLYSGPRSQQHGVDNFCSSEPGKLQLTFNCLTDLALCHPAVLTVILGQARWAAELVPNGQLQRTYNKLQVEKQLQLLQGFQEENFTESQKASLIGLLKQFAAISRTKRIYEALDRYPVNPRFRKELEQLLSSKSKKFAHKIWRQEKNGIYDGFDCYGFYTWAEEHCASSVDKELTMLDEDMAYLIRVRS